MRWIAVALFLFQLGLTSSLHAQDTAALWQRSYDLEAAGNVTGALSEIRRLPETERTSYLFMVRRAWLLYLGRRYQESVSAYRQAQEESPEAVEARIGLMMPLMALRRWREVELVARGALRLDADNYLVSRRLALALYNLGRFEEAERLYRRVSSRYPSDLEMRSGIGWCLLRRGSVAAARVEFESVLSVSPRDASALSGVSAVRAALVVQAP